VIPIVSLVGRKDSGKTTFIASLIPLLEAKGLRVACVKQHKHDVPVDIEGKDSWIYAQAGASCSIMSTSRQLSLVYQREEMADLDELAHVAARSGCHILIGESFNSFPFGGGAEGDGHRDTCDRKRGEGHIQNLSRYVVARRDRAEEPRFSPKESTGIITDDPELARQWREAKRLAFDLNNVESFADFLYISSKILEN
jgi:hypothetical protein